MTSLLKRIGDRNPVLLSILARIDYISGYVLSLLFRHSAQFIRIP